MESDVKYDKSNKNVKEIMYKYHTTSYYLTKGFSLDEATKLVEEHVKYVTRPARVKSAQSRIEKNNFVGITPIQLINYYIRIYEKLNSIPVTRNYDSVLVDIMRCRNVDASTAMVLFEDAIDKFPTKRVLATTEFIKYLFGENSDVYQSILERNKKCVSCSFEKFSENYDDKDLAYKEFCEKYGSNNKEHLKKKYGVDDSGVKEIIRQRAQKYNKTISNKTPEERKELNKKKANTLENYISRHGEEVGRIRWNALMEKRKGQCSLEYYINKLGEEAGKRKYFESRGDRSKYPWCKEYWIEKEGSIEEGINRYKEHMSSRPHFSQEYCIEKYGQKEGYRIWKERNDNWISGILSKDPEELERINKSKAVTLEKMIAKFGEEEGTIRYNDWLFKIATATSGVMFSKEGSKFFLRLYKKLRKLGIIDHRSEVMFGTKSTSEFMIRHESGYSFYDFFIPKLDFIVEFNGVAYHPREGDFAWKSARGVSYEDAINKDKFKHRLAVDSGYVIEYVWSDADKESEIERLCNILLERMEEYFGRDEFKFISEF